MTLQSSSPSNWRHSSLLHTTPSCVGLEFVCVYVIFVIGMNLFSPSCRFIRYTKPKSVWSNLPTVNPLHKKWGDVTSAYSPGCNQAFLLESIRKQWNNCKHLFCFLLCETKNQTTDPLRMQWCIAVMNLTNALNHGECAAVFTFHLQFWFLDTR